MEAWRAAQVELPSASKQRQVLATLLLNANRVTHFDTLVRELWSGDPPLSVRTTLQTYVYQLRRLLAPSGSQPRIVTRGRGYLMVADESRIDTSLFESLVAEAHSEMTTRPERAMALLDEATGLWRGPMLGDLPQGEILRRHIARFEDLRMRATILGNEIRLRTGHHRELVAELKAQVLQYPLNEDLHAQLIRALALSGRRRDALAVFHNGRKLLCAELGVRQGTLLGDALHRVLTDTDVAGRCA